MSTLTREICFDTETTGLSAEEDRIFELGMVEIEGRLPTGRVLHLRFNPEKPLSADSVRITGVKDADLAHEPLFAERIDDILTFIGTSPLVAHNASFDMSFLQAEFARCGRSLPPNPVVDTLEIAKKELPGMRHTLDALCRRYNIDLSVRTVHGALLDAQLLAEVYVELTGGLQASLIEALDETATSTVAAAKSGPASATIRPRTVIEPTAEEQAAHQAFLQKWLPQHPWAA